MNLTVLIVRLAATATWQASVIVHEGFALTTQISWTADETFATRAEAWAWARRITSECVVGEGVPS